MRESVVVAKEADWKKESSPTKSGDNNVHRAQHEPETQLGSLRGVIGNIRRDGGTPSAESIATQLSIMHTTQRTPALLALQQTHGNRYVQRVVTGIQAKLRIGQPSDIYEQEAAWVADEVMRMPEPTIEPIQTNRSAKSPTLISPAFADLLQSKPACNASTATLSIESQLIRSVTLEFTLATKPLR